MSKQGLAQVRAALEKVKKAKVSPDGTPSPEEDQPAPNKKAKP